MATGEAVHRRDIMKGIKTLMNESIYVNEEGGTVGLDGGRRSLQGLGLLVAGGTKYI